MQIALTIAGSDSGGGAGIQADLKTFQRFGVYGTSVITAVTAQNTLGVRAAHPVPVDIVRAQLAALAEDLPAAACKTGMLASAELIEVVAENLPSCPYVCDPVMVATSGDRLLDAGAERILLERLVPRATVVTPNLFEAEILAGFAIAGPEAMERAGQTLLEQGAEAALVKGGHLPGDVLVDVLVTRNGVRRFEAGRLATTSTHGTGCTLSAAITAGLAVRTGGRADGRTGGRTDGRTGGRTDGRTDGRTVKSEVLMDAVAEAIAFVRRAIAAAPGLGRGHGPLG
jgi:hydroxymethylpyrimidine/phosphomethylpyrimidine kinase